MGKGSKQRDYDEVLERFDPEKTKPHGELRQHLMEEFFDLSYGAADSAAYAYRRRKKGELRSRRGSQEEYDRLLDDFRAWDKDIPAKECEEYLQSLGFTYDQAKNAVYRYRRDRRDMVIIPVPPKATEEASKPVEETTSAGVDEFSFAEEISDPELYPEGAKHQTSVNTYEKSSKARQKCIEYYGTKCIICGFSFADKYGEVGADFIHVHHIVPLSEIGDGYLVDPIKDLRQVCPNCHAIIHKRKPAFGIEEIRQFVREAELKSS